MKYPPQMSQNPIFDALTKLSDALSKMNSEVNTQFVAIRQEICTVNSESTKRNEQLEKIVMERIDQIGENMSSMKSKICPPNEVDISSRSSRLSGLTESTTFSRETHYLDDVYDEKDFDWATDMSEQMHFAISDENYIAGIAAKVNIDARITNLRFVDYSSYIIAICFICGYLWNLSGIVLK